MPVPIKPVQDNSIGYSSPVDYSFLADYSQPTTQKKSKFVSASNKDAELLFEIWDKGEHQEGSNTDTFILDETISSRDILRLKTYGFLTGGIDKVQFTIKGKTVITTMVLSEPNRFEIKKQNKSYRDILAGMNKIGKPGYRIPKYAANTSNNMDLRGI